MTTQINRFFSSVIFKIGIIIILAEMAVLAVAGYIYINRFSDQVDRRISAQVQIPGKLMRAELLSTALRKYLPKRNRVE